MKCGYDSDMIRYPFFILFLLIAGRISLGPHPAPSRRIFSAMSKTPMARCLEAAEATYKNDAGVVVHLISAVHIADPEFFAGLNESFDHYDALLYELVTSGDGPPIPSTQRSKESSLAWVGNLQRFLRDHLDLVFQLDAIDYDRPNFVHADLDAETFAALQADRGESMFTLMLRSALQNMSKAEKKGPDLSGLQLIGDCSIQINREN